MCTRVGVMRASCISPVDRISRPALVRQSSPAGAPQNEHRMRKRCSMRCLRIARHFSSCAGVLITSLKPPSGECDEARRLAAEHCQVSHLGTASEPLSWRNAEPGIRGPGLARGPGPPCSLSQVPRRPGPHLAEYPGTKCSFTYYNLVRRNLWHQLCGSWKRGPLWVLQVAGSNPAAPTSKIRHFLHY